LLAGWVASFQVGWLIRAELAASSILPAGRSKIEKAPLLAASSQPAPKMCDRCRSSITTFYTKHPESKCPLFAAYYCGICAVHGHLQGTCKAAAAAASTAFEPAEATEPDDTPAAATIDIKDNDAAIAAFLTARGMPASRKPAENREQLAAYAASEGSILCRHWVANIALPGGNQIRASVNSLMTPAELVESIRHRGFELPARVILIASKKHLASFNSITYKDQIVIAAK
jgi:hypothetical protein